MSSAGGLFSPHPPGLAGRSLMNISMSLWEQSRSRQGGGVACFYTSHISSHVGKARLTFKVKGKRRILKLFFLFLFKSSSLVFLLF